MPATGSSIRCSRGSRAEGVAPTRTHQEQRLDARVVSDHCSLNVLIHFGTATRRLRSWRRGDIMFDLPLDDLPLDDCTRRPVAHLGASRGSCSRTPIGASPPTAWSIARPATSSRATPSPCGGAISGNGRCIWPRRAGARRAASGEAFLCRRGGLRGSRWTPASRNPSPSAFGLVAGAGRDGATDGTSWRWAISFGRSPRVPARPGSATPAGEARAGDAARRRAGRSADGRGSTPARRSLRLSGRGDRARTSPAAIQDVTVRRRSLLPVRPRDHHVEHVGSPTQTPRRSRASTDS